MASSISNPLPILQGWDQSSSSFSTLTNGIDNSANQLDFPLLYVDIDGCSAWDTATEGLRVKALEAIRQYYQWDHGFSPIYALRLVSNWRDIWSSAGLDSPFLFLAAHRPEIVVEFYALFRDLMQLTDVHDDFRLHGSHSWSDNPHYAPVLLEEMMFIRHPIIRRWTNVFRSWKQDADLVQLQCKVTGFQTRFGKVEGRWASLKDMLDALKKDVHIIYITQISHSLDMTFDFFHEEMQECQDTLSRLEMEEANKLVIPEMGIARTRSMSSAVEPVPINSTGRSRVNQARPPGPRKLRKSPPRTSIRYGGRRTRQRAADKEPRLWRILGLSLVTWLVVLSLPFTVLATFLCEAAEGVPMYDSNFYSTLSQQLLGFGGLYAIVKPQLEQWLTAFKRSDLGEDPPKGIKTNWPIMFNCLVGTAFLTLLASSPIYPYHPQFSIPLGAMAAICANLATLLIIEDTGTQIVVQGDMIEGLEHQLDDYRRRGL
ncbi:hypothetical protein CSUB01_11925 [Colletotrichum sublineola]|uniref:Uncharacterized protein n=1 Tax=Colletotrichum sublineola TaxID=1173701 RepID=A0A066XVY2_COLSU|nr:hypothetical protein CSUB01_11925 [Colletotrichum sublineola]